MFSLPFRRGRALVLSRHRLSSQRNYHEVSFLNPGDPADVLQYHASPKDPPLQDVQEDYVKVNMLQAPWNPADQNTVQGKYPSPLKNRPRQSLSSQGEGWKVAGSEGWGRIEESKDPHLPPGTFVTMGISGMGTLRSSLWLPKQAVIPIRRGEELQEEVGPSASTLFQLGGTAWRMLHDFEALGEHSFIVQNAGNSGVGWMISQLAAQRNIHVISLVRRGNRSEQDFHEMVSSLKNNHTTVIAEEALLENKEEMKEWQSALSNYPPQLALNSVGGASAGLLLKLLAPGGTMVTYGGLSMQPVTVATPQLIFKDVKVCGYWHSRWMARAFPQAKKQMMDELAESVLEGGIEPPPVEIFPLSLIQEALRFEKEQSSQAVRKKIVLECRE